MYSGIARQRLICTGGIMEDLKTYLSAVSPGHISDTSELLPKLSACWARFNGSDANSMSTTTDLEDCGGTITSRGEEGEGQVA